MPKKDLTGGTFGRWKVQERCVREDNNSTYWRCVCKCGTVKEVRAATLINGESQSCGCLRSEINDQFNRKHGGWNRPEYQTWRGVRRRCQDPKYAGYCFYGAKGITICERWEDFAAFWEDMGPRPSPGHSIDRIRNDLGYEPGNCRWATEDEQKANTTRNRHLTFNGETKTIKQWSDIMGFNDATLRCRIKRGWSIDRALTEPVNLYSRTR